MRQGISAGDFTNRINKRFLFADYTRQVEAAKLGIRTPINIQGLNAGTNQSSVLKNMIEGAQYTTAAEQQIYINEVRALAPTPASVPEPEPEPEPTPGPEPGTQLLLNPEFTDITGVAADGWTSSTGWQAWAYEGGGTNRPCVLTEMPIRDVYPTSTSTGFIIFSYVLATISQTINITGLGGNNTINTVLNIANVSNGSADQYTFTVIFYGGSNGTGSILYNLTTGSVTAPSVFTDITLTLDRDTSPNFDNIRSIKVSITSRDSGNWGGQYGPAMDYCRLIVN